MKPKRKLDLTKVRTRYEPPTLEEAIFAAQGLTSNIEHQVQIAAQLCGAPECDVREAVLQAQAHVTCSTNVRPAGAQRLLIVERKARRGSFKPLSASK